MTSVFYFYNLKKNLGLRLEIGLDLELRLEIGCNQELRLEIGLDPGLRLGLNINCFFAFDLCGSLTSVAV